MGLIHGVGDLLDEFDELELLNEARMELERPKTIAIADDQLICECLCVSAGEIRNFLEVERICSSEVTKEFLTAKLNLGKGCSSCLKNFDYWIKKI